MCSVSELHVVLDWHSRQSNGGHLKQLARISPKPIGSIAVPILTHYLWVTDRSPGLESSARQIRQLRDSRRFCLESLSEGQESGRFPRRAQLP